MSYCAKCGNKIDENMAFCPRCGAPLKPGVKAAAPFQTQRGEKAEKAEKQEKNEKQEPEKSEKQEKSEYGFIGWLIGGLILIAVGLIAVLQFSNIIPSGTMGPILFLIVGCLIIIAALYYVFSARKRNPIT
ncbi:MAG: zinc-ribbon domain-containing protein [Candidatus Bathyarchaeota archaeon]|jgi:uncharacterized membrane protein YvbJ|nr:zinc-ribbon domain-containing protein [Candidatus Bathyarchaeota archaeon]